jgi:hypothetical protein
MAVVEIDNFTAAEFEAFLATFCRENKCHRLNRAGERDGQVVYTIRPFAAMPIGLFVWSSIDPSSGRSDAKAGGDSIRCVCCRFDEEPSSVTPFGGKSVRWVDRRKGGKGWGGRLGEALAALLSQVRWLRALDRCPHCAGDLVPLTSRTGENKGRPFVACTFKECPGRKGGPFGFFQWTDGEPPTEAARTPATPSEAVKPTDPTIPNAERQEGAKTGQEGPTHLPCDVCRRSCKVFKCGEHTKTPGARFISCDKGRGGCGRWVIVNVATWGQPFEPRQTEAPQPLAPRTEAPTPFALTTARRAMDAAALLVQRALRSLDEATGGGQFPDPAEKAGDDLRAALRLLTGAADDKERTANAREQQLRK